MEEGGIEGVRRREREGGRKKGGDGWRVRGSERMSKGKREAGKEGR